MPVYNSFNYGKVVLRTFHASPNIVVLRTMPSIHNNQQRFPNVADVRAGVVYGPGQYEQQEYLVGTMASGGDGSSIFIVNE